MQSNLGLVSRGYRRKNIRNIVEEIKSTLQIKMFQSRLISKRAKLKLYYLVIRPIATYSCETWILKETIINKLLVFERKILRKIFGPNNENGI
jgi:hypothetical protein